LRKGVTRRATLPRVVRRRGRAGSPPWRRPPERRLWVAGSVLLLVSGRFEPNALGFAFVLGQAAAVAVFAEMQYVGLRKSTVSAA
jgi:hypothetical protein